MTDACAAAASNVVLTLLELQITLVFLALTNSLCEFALVSSAICQVISYDFSKCVPHNQWKATLMPTANSRKLLETRSAGQHERIQARLAIQKRREKDGPDQTTGWLVEGSFSERANRPSCLIRTSSG